MGSSSNLSSSLHLVVAQVLQPLLLSPCPEKQFSFKKGKSFVEMEILGHSQPLQVF